MSKPIIFLDMDGVLADFHQGTADLFGVNLNDCKMSTPWEYAVEQQISDLTQQRVTGSYMWNKINTASTMGDFWFNLKPYPWAHELYKLCLEYSSKLIISTSPGYHYKAWGDKIRWLEKHLGHHPRDVMMGPRKELLACAWKEDQTRLLIDDSEHNTKAFHNAGGNVTLFPQNWNSACDAKTHEQKMILVESQLKHYYGNSACDAKTHEQKMILVESQLKHYYGNRTK